MDKTNKKSIFLQYWFISLPILIFICGISAAQFISWPSAKSDLASLLAGILTDHQYGEKPIIYGIGNISNYLYGSLVLSFATILFLLVWLGVDIGFLYLLIREIKKKKQKSRAKKIWENIKNPIASLWLLLIWLILFISPFLLLSAEWKHLTENWKLARPNPENDYQIRTQTLKETDSVSHSGVGQYYSYTEYFIEFDSDDIEYQILNTGVLEKSYDALQEGQTVYTIVEIQPNRQKRIFYADDTLKEVEKVLENYLQ